MIKLHGMALSNFYSMTRHVLLEKGVQAEFVKQYPGQEPDFLAKSPMGKVPVLETDEGFLTEADVIFTYLDEVYPDPALFPDDAFEKARVKQLIKVVELYIEGPVHLLVGVIFGREIPVYVKESCPAQATRGLEALGRLARFSPWVCGSQFTAADIFLFYSVTMSRRLVLQVYNRDILDEVSGLADWYALMEKREVTQQVTAELNAALDALAIKQTAKQGK